MLTITPAQIRGARGMLDWSMMDLAKASGVSVSTVKRVGDGRMAMVSTAMVGQIRGAFEAAGVEFLGDEGSGSGVMLKPRQDQTFSRFMR